VVLQVAVAASALGDQYLKDVLTLRSGEPWHDRLLQLIEEADVFQLFWSSNSMHSPHCRTEWEYALALGRPMFVRPLYWEDPFPEAPDLGMPPDELRRLHFARVPVAASAEDTIWRPHPSVEAPARPSPAPYAAAPRSAPKSPPPRSAPKSPPPRSAPKSSSRTLVVAVAVLILTLALCAVLVVSRGGGP
jgi:hypothetical protein